MSAVLKLCLFCVAYDHQGEALAFVSLRHNISGKHSDDNDGTKQKLHTAARRLAQRLPQPDRAVEGLNTLISVRDNHVFTALQQALAPDTTTQVGGHTAHSTRL